jgi:predicted helicase
VAAHPEEHPLMRTALRVLSLDEVVQDVGIGFEVMRDTVNSFAPEILAIRRDGSDPILYFYEDFLQTFDPQARERYGVYYTPLEVVRYMVGALDRALRENLMTEGLRDPDVTILDPAAGTGTFLLGIAERVRTQSEDEAGGGMAALALQNLARRMFGFELLVGPYAVAHYRLHHALRHHARPQDEEQDSEPLELPRLGVYLADTLAEPGAAAPIGPLGFVSEGIQDERREANRIKTEQPILAIIGNPPYRRLEVGENETLVGRWMDQHWDDLKAPVRDAGQGNQLNTFPELSVVLALGDLEALRG